MFDTGIVLNIGLIYRQGATGGATTRATIIAIVNYDDYQQNNATGCNGVSNDPCNDGCNDPCTEDKNI